MSFNIELQSGSAVRLKTRGKYCDRDIVVTATGGGGVAEPIIKPLEIIENGIYTASDGVDGYSPVTVNVPAGASVQTATGLFNRTGEVNIGFRPDVICMTRNEQNNGEKYFACIDFAATGATKVKTAIWSSHATYAAFAVGVSRTANGFNVSEITGYKYDFSFISMQSTFNFTAIKYIT